MSRGILYSKLSELNPKIILEIGACDFLDSISFKDSFPNAEIFSVEADLINYERHQQKALSKGIKAFNFAMSDVDGTTIFYPSLMELTRNQDWRFAGSICKPLLKPETNEALNHTVVYDVDGYEIITKRFDTFCKELNIQEIDLLFIDVEGAEYKVLSSLGELRPKLIFSETAHYEVKNYENELNLKQFDEFLSSLGYKIFERLQYDTLYIYE